MGALCESDYVDRTPQPRPSPVRPKGPQAYKGNGGHGWEKVSDQTVNHGSTWRLRVPGGFLYLYNNANPVFVPMPEVVGYVG
jgi:hypothetical protein